MPLVPYAVLTVMTLIVCLPVAVMAKSFTTQIGATLMFTAVLTTSVWLPV